MSKYYTYSVAEGCWDVGCREICAKVSEMHCWCGTASAFLHKSTQAKTFFPLLCLTQLPKENMNRVIQWLRLKQDVGIYVQVLVLCTYSVVWYHCSMAMRRGLKTTRCSRSRSAGFKESHIISKVVQKKVARLIHFPWSFKVFFSFSIFVNICKILSWSKFLQSITKNIAWSLPTIKYWMRKQFLLKYLELIDLESNIKWTLKNKWKKERCSSLNQLN